MITGCFFWRKQYISLYICTNICVYCLERVCTSTVNFTSKSIKALDLRMIFWTQHFPRLLYLLFFYCSDNTPYQIVLTEESLLWQFQREESISQWFRSRAARDKCGSRNRNWELIGTSAWQQMRELRNHIFICKLKVKIQPEVMQSFKFQVLPLWHTSFSEAAPLHNLQTAPSTRNQVYKCLCQCGRFSFKTPLPNDCQRNHSSP